MSDFINHLFSRSFAFDSDPLSINPRLPSLFETPLTEQQKFVAPLFTQQEQPLEQRNPAPEDNEHASAASAVQFSPRSITTSGLNTDLSLAGRTSQDMKHHGSSDLLNEHNRPQNDEEITRVIGSSNHLAGHKSAVGAFQPLFQIHGFTAREDIVPPENRLPVNKKKFPLFPEQRMQSAEAGNEIDPLADGRPGSAEKMASRVSDQPVLEHVMIPSIGQQNLSDKDKTASLLPKRTPSLQPAVNSVALKLPRLSAEIFDHKHETVAEPAEPVINVTIGRIEIRATPGSPAPVRKNHAHRPSAMSLDDYLNKRNGGAR